MGVRRVPMGLVRMFPGGFLVALVMMLGRRAMRLGRLVMMIGCFIVVSAGHLNAPFPVRGRPARALGSDGPAERCRQRRRPDCCFSARALLMGYRAPTT